MGDNTLRVVIVGCGRVGARTALLLTEAGHEVTVIDVDETAFARLGPEFAGQTVRGNAIEQDTLRAAGADDADVFVAATTGDNRNIMTSQIAKNVFGVRKVIARIKDPERARIYQGLGIEVDCRTISGSLAILDSLGLEVEVESR